MVRIAPVQLQYNPKTYWFDPGDLDICDGQNVVVVTERGTELGASVGGIIEAEQEAVDALKTPLKPVLRVATDDDIEQAEEMRRKGEEALPVFRKLAAEENENMHPIMVEYLLDGDKAVFFFEAEERIDFRNLVRKLANEFKIRVDMRQIGVRDEARMVGGMGHCGQELCCKRLGGEFCPVSIRMAKEQDLSLNPQKISGVCGRLMCCLRYEFEAYKDFKSRAPKQGGKVETPAGIAKVVELNVPKETVTVYLEEEGKRVTFPLSAMDEPAEGEKRPRRIGDVFEEYANPDPFAVTTASLGLFDTAAFTREDKLGTPEVHHNSLKDQEQEEKAPSRRRRRRKSSSQAASESSASEASEKKASGDPAANQGSKTSSRRRSRRSRGTNTSGQATLAPRPGQKASALSAKGSDSGSAPVPSAHRRARRRSHKTGSESNES